MSFSEVDQKEVDRRMAAAWEKFYVPGMGSKEAKAFKAAWTQSYFEAWHDGYLARLEGRSVTDGPGDPTVPSRPRRHRRKLHRECACLCHLELGGGVHHGVKCACNGGTGFDSGSDHVRVIY